MRCMFGRKPASLFAFLILFASALSGQQKVNPSNQISWPSHCADSGLMVYNWLTNNCFAVGSSVNPIVYMGTWSGSTTYATNNAVYYAGSQYISLVDSNFNQNPGSSPLSWALLVSGGGNIASVFGRTGVVTAQSGDYNFGQIAGTALASQLPPATNSTQGAIKPDGSSCTVTAGVLSCSGSGVPSVFGRTGAISAATNDYNFNQIAGTASVGQLPTATNSAKGILQPDGSTCTVTSGTLTCNGIGGAITSVFGRTGAITAATNDYAFGQIAGTVAASQLPAATSSAQGAIRPDNTSCTVTAGVLSCTGGTATFPTAAHPGQIMTATAPGTTYAAQGQVFYQQSGDTIASIETACSSLCTYIVTGPQTITLASNHTLSSHVNVQFMNGGKWTVTGATLTIPTRVSGTLTQHFVSNVLFTTAQGSVNGEWFGAVADWNGTTGTDNLTTMQNALNSISGTDNSMVLQNGTYMVSSTIVLNKNGIKGTVDSQDEFAGSNIIITSPTATIVQAIGSVGSFTWASMDHVCLLRSVVPTGTATGLYAEYMYGIFRNVQSNDSIRDFYGHGALAVFDTTYAKWGFTGLHMPAGNYYGYWFDSQDGQPMNGLTILESVTNSDPAGTDGTFTGLHIIGSQLQDIYTNHFQTNGGNNAIDLIYTGANPGTSGLAYDIHFNNVLLDHFSHRGIFIQNIPTESTASVEVRNGTIGSLTATAPCIDIEGSTGVSVTNMTSLTCQQAVNDTVFVSGSTLITISGNNFPGLGASNVRGIHITGGTKASVVTNNTIQGTSLAGQAGIFVDGVSTNNVIANNALQGPLQWGVIVDSSTSGLTGLYTNALYGTMTTPFTDSGNNPTNATTIVANSTHFGTNGDIIASGYGSGGYNSLSFNGQSTDGLRLGIVGGSSSSGDPNLYLGTPAGGDFYFLTGSPQVSAGRLTTAGLFIPAIGVKPAVYTVATLPSASTLGAGAMVSVSDATTFTPGTCTGGGSDPMLAISNGSTWSCH